MLEPRYRRVSCTAILLTIRLGPNLNRNVPIIQYEGQWEKASRRLPLPRMNHRPDPAGVKKNEGQPGPKPRAI